jgi:hypothetical protein
VDQFEDISFRKKDIDYAQILRMHLLTISQAGLMKSDIHQGHKPFTPQDYKDMAIYTLEDLLFPYQDEQFHRDKAEAMQQGSSTRNILRCCINLMHRRGLLLKETITAVV